MIYLVLLVGAAVFYLVVTALAYTLTKWLIGRSER